MLFRQLFLLLPVLLMLASCAVIDEKQLDSKTILKTKGYTAWSLSATEQRMASSNNAVSLLLAQADELINIEKLEQASDKLERLLRIDPRFSQAWSRLSWIALKNGLAKRSQQLAQRSNSYSRNNAQLKILNWRFIQKAAELMSDFDLVEQAQQMISKLDKD